MPNAGEIILDIRAHHDKLNADLGRAKSAMAGTVSNLENSVNTGALMNSLTMIGSMLPGVGGQISMVAGNVGQLSGGLGGLTSSLGAVGTAGAVTVGVLAAVAAAAVAIGAISVPAAAAKEDMLVTFGVILKGADAAKKLVAQMEALADRTPLETDDIAKAGRTLLAMGYDVSEVIPMIETLGDAAVASGKGAEGLTRLALIMGQIRQKGRLQGDELLQLAEAGISPMKALGEATGKVGKDLQKMIENGMVSSEMAIAAITKSMQQQFKGAMDASSQTFNGKLSSLRDAWTRIKQQIGEPILVPLTMMLDSLSTGATSFSVIKAILTGGLEDFLIAQEIADKKLDERSAQRKAKRKKDAEMVGKIATADAGASQMSELQRKIDRSIYRLTPEDKRWAEDRAKAIDEAYQRTVDEIERIKSTQLKTGIIRVSDGEFTDALGRAKELAEKRKSAITEQIAAQKEAAQKQKDEIKQQTADTMAGIKRQASDRASAVVAGLQKEFNAHQEFLNKLKSIYDTYVASSASVRSRMTGITVENVGKKQAPDWSNMKNQMEQGFVDQGFSNYGMVQQKERSFELGGAKSDEVLRRLDKLISVMTYRTIPGVAT